jgi:hypothetical protein
MWRKRERERDKEEGERDMGREERERERESQRERERKGERKERKRERERGRKKVLCHITEHVSIATKTMSFVSSRQESIPPTVLCLCETATPPFCYNTLLPWISEGESER